MAILRNPFVIAGGALVLILLFLGWYISQEPGYIDVVGTDKDSKNSSSTVIGYATTNALIGSVEMLLNKNGGYLSNDVLPPYSMVDNIPNWEFGVLQQARDLAKTLRNDYSRSQTQSVADKDLEVAEPKFNVDSAAWLFPSAEGEYEEGIELIGKYLDRLQDPTKQDAQFFARADNLNEWLSLVEKRLGSLSQRLSSSRKQVRVNTDLAGDANAQQSTSNAAQVVSKTSWFEIDDNFYEARGTAWALIHYLKAAEIDFAPVLEDKNAIPSLRQIIVELEATQQSLSTPMIMNGKPMGMFSNHSLVMSSYISRANAAIADLRKLLSEG